MFKQLIYKLYQKLNELNCLNKCQYLFQASNYRSNQVLSFKIFRSTPVPLQMGLNVISSKIICFTFISGNKCQIELIFYCLKPTHNVINIILVSVEIEDPSDQQTELSFHPQRFPIVLQIHKSSDKASYITHLRQQSIVTLIGFISQSS